jgi:hypothetical protein
MRNLAGMRPGAGHVESPMALCAVGPPGPARGCHALVEHEILEICFGPKQIYGLNRFRAWRPGPSEAEKQGDLRPQGIHTWPGTSPSTSVAVGLCRPGLVVDQVPALALVGLNSHHRHHPPETSLHPPRPRIPEASQAACTCGGAASCTGTRSSLDFQGLGTYPLPPVSKAVMKIRSTTTPGH